MSRGITTSRAHLDPLDPVVYPLDPSVAQIDWSQLLAWLKDMDPGTEKVDFAGRYFLGAATEAERIAGSGFCLWAHGEASDPVTPARIVPLQRADPVRQSATGGAGEFFGSQDATALAQQIDRCLAVGELLIAGTAQVVVFLEVGDRTPLSVEYWASWATTVHDAMLFAARLAARVDAEGTQPLVPAILCAFAFDAETQKFLPEPGVRACLDTLGPPGFRNHCHGLWARRLPGDPGLAMHPFDWSTMGEYRQPRPFLGLAAPYMQRVPVRYLRSFDGAGGLPMPEGPLPDTLSLVTIDEAAPDGADAPPGATLTRTGWRADARDGKSLVEMPSQFGVDMSEGVTDASAACLAGAQVVVKSLPYRLEGTPVNLRGPCSFAIRYYRPEGGEPFTAAESQALSVNGVQVVAVLQGTAPTKLGTAAYVRGLIAPFVKKQGWAHGFNAFTYAADVIRQPPYTPIYFAIDFPVGHPGYQPLPPDATPEMKADPVNAPVPTPSVATILSYFQDVRAGHRDYLKTHPQTPYHVGVYTGWDPNALAALYRTGLASHFWQTPFGRGAPFPHLNVWQIGMFSTAGVFADNAALNHCKPAGVVLRDKQLWVDIDCAWGDPGGFSVE